MIYICNSNLSTTESSEMLPMELNDHALEYSEQEKHLGLQRTPDGKMGKTVEKRIQSGRRTAYMHSWEQDCMD